ncbi:hypothetical protein OQA88_8622 [Cercophora sp. LCS_1]
MGSTLGAEDPAVRCYKFQAIPEFFRYSEGLTQPHDVTTQPGLGLVKKVYETDASFDPNHEKQDWERFEHYLKYLNATARDGISYKLIYAARHGEGYHNVKEAEVGTPAWESHWAKLDGDGKTVWFDATLTPKGRQQAQAMKAFWEESAVALKLPLAKRHYSSPMQRCLDTCQTAFTGLTLADGTEVPPFKPTIRELIRERLGVHTCDKRHPRSWIQEYFPIFETIEEDLPEEDTLWVPDVRETLEQHAVRVHAFLSDLFTNDNETIISVTSHSGTIQALNRATGHPAVHVAPGAIVPLLIKGELTDDIPPRISVSL